MHEKRTKPSQPARNATFLDTARRALKGDVSTLYIELQNLHRTCIHNPYRTPELF